MPTNSFAHLLKSTPFYTWVRAGVSAHSVNYFLTAGAETATKKCVCVGGGGGGGGGLIAQLYAAKGSA